MLKFHQSLEGVEKKIILSSSSPSSPSDMPYSTLCEEFSVLFVCCCCCSSVFFQGYFRRQRRPESRHLFVIFYFIFFPNDILSSQKVNPMWFYERRRLLCVAVNARACLLLMEENARSFARKRTNEKKNLNALRRVHWSGMNYVGERNEDSNTKE